MRKISFLVVLVIATLFGALVLRAEEKPATPDLSQFKWHKVCHDNLATPPKLTIDWYIKNVEKNLSKNEYVNVVTVIETGFKGMQYTVMENDKLVNDNTRYGQLFVRIDNKWKEVDYKTYLELLKQYIPKIYLMDSGHIYWVDKFTCKVKPNPQ